MHGNKVLKKGAIPSMFDFPQRLQNVIKQRRVLKRKYNELGPTDETKLSSSMQMEVNYSEEEPSKEILVPTSEGTKTPSTSTTG